LHAAADAFGAAGADRVPGVGAAVIADAVGGAVALRAADLRAGDAYHQGGDKKQNFLPHETCLVNRLRERDCGFVPCSEPISNKSIPIPNPPPDCLHNPAG
jgi:hypothetical protein